MNLHLSKQCPYPILANKAMNAPSDFSWPQVIGKAMSTGRELKVVEENVVKATAGMTSRKVRPSNSCEM